MEILTNDEERQSSSFTEVYVWGGDQNGQLGLGQKYTGKTYSSPKFCSFNLVIKEISCGEDHAAFITSRGYIYTMGSNIQGRLGIGDKSIRQSSSPCLVESLSRSKAKAIACGRSHTLAILESGEVYSWGSGEHGALGHGNRFDSWLPEKLFLDPKVFIAGKKVSAGSRHSAVVSEFGNLFVFGDNDSGQLGTGTRDPELKPVQLTLVSEAVSDVSCGIFHTLILTDKGRVYSTGGNLYGQLGHGSKRSTNIPTKIKEFDHLKVVKISCGHHSAALTEKGDIYIWGTGVFGEYLSPLKFSQSGHFFKDISVGSFFGSAVDDKGNVWTWGSNASGELGLGDFEPRVYPFQNIFMQNKKVSRLACGGSFVVALGPIKRDPQTSSTPSFPTFSEEQAYKFQNQQTQQINYSMQTPMKNEYSTPDLDQFTSTTKPRSKSPGLVRNQSSLSPFRGDDTATRQEESEYRERMASQYKSESNLSTKKFSPLKQHIESKSKFEDPFVELILKQKGQLENNLKQERKEKNLLENNLIELKKRLKELQEGPEGLLELSESLNKQASRFDELKRVYEEECRQKDLLAVEVLEERKKNERLNDKLFDKDDKIMKLEQKVMNLEDMLKEKSREVESYRNGIAKTQEKNKYQNAQNEEEIIRLQNLVKDLQAENDQANNGLLELENLRKLELEEKTIIENQSQDLEKKLNQMFERLSENIAQLEYEQATRLRFEQDLSISRAKEEEATRKVTSLLTEVDKLKALLEKNLDNEHENNSRMLEENEQLQGIIENQNREIKRLNDVILDLQISMNTNADKNQNMYDIFNKTIEKQAEEFKRKALNSLFGPAKKLAETLAKPDKSPPHYYEQLEKPDFGMSNSSLQSNLIGDTLIEPLDLEKLKKQIYDESTESRENSAKFLNTFNPEKTTQFLDKRNSQESKTNPFIYEIPEYEYQDNDDGMLVKTSPTSEGNHVPDSLMRNILGMSQGPVEDDFNDKENFQTPIRRDTLADRMSSGKNKLQEIENDKSNTPGRQSLRFKNRDDTSVRTDKDVKYSLRSPDYYQNLKDVKDRLNALQKNKQALETKMLDFERKLKSIHK